MEIGGWHRLDMRSDCLLGMNVSFQSVENILELVLVGSGCCSKMPPPGWLKQQNYIQDQFVHRVGFW